MKQYRHIFMLVVFGATTFRGHAQYQPGVPYADATRFYRALSTAADPMTDYNNKQDLLKIVAYYFNRKVTTAADVNNLLAGNPFLNVYNVAAIPASPGGLPPSQPIGGGSAGLLGMDVTNVADAIAKFLIKRGKQELSMTFFNRFNDELAKFPEFKYLFPRSVQVIAHVGSFNYQSLLQQLKDAFSKDMANMPSNILSLRNIAATECNGNAACLARVATINNVFSTTAAHDSREVILPLLAMQGIIDGNNIIEIVNKLAADASVCGVNDNFSGLVKLTSIFMESFRTDQPSNGALFINQSSLYTLFQSQDMLNIFLGLVYQKYQAMSCYHALTIGGNTLEQVFKGINTARDQFYNVMTSFDKINLAYSILQKNIQAKTSDIQDYTSVVSASMGMISTIMEAIQTAAPGTLPASYARFKGNITIGAEICNDIAQKNYAGIFTGAIQLINDNKIISENDTREKIVQYLSFAANLSSAKSSDEIENAIETIALPPGSYSVKQKSSINVSLNGYIGYAWDFNGGLYANGIYAPVGVSLNFGLGKKHGGALSLFASVIDVGAVASYRLANSDTDTLKQNIRLESIISPSAQLVFEIPKTPIAVCGGWRMTPKLFYSKDDVFKAVAAKNSFNVSILVDIPIITLFNRPFRN